LNQLDGETIRNHVDASAPDERSTFTKIIDLIDLPRNTVASILAPGLERRARMAGNVGTGGQGKVFFSDILKEAGVDNPVLSAVLGFAGDVVTRDTRYADDEGFARSSHESSISREN
jgi:hypothetical protein